MKVFGISLLFVSLFSLFLSVERCSNNSSKVEGINRQLGSSPFGGMVAERIEPVMPTISKYALFFFIVCGATGTVILVKSKAEKETITDFMKIQTQQKREQSSEKKES